MRYEMSVVNLETMTFGEHFVAKFAVDPVVVVACNVSLSLSVLPESRKWFEIQFNSPFVTKIFLFGLVFVGRTFMIIGLGSPVIRLCFLFSKNCGQSLSYGYKLRNVFHFPRLIDVLHIYCQALKIFLLYILFNHEFHALKVINIQIFILVASRPF